MKSGGKRHAFTAKDAEKEKGAAGGGIVILYRDSACVYVGGADDMKAELKRLLAGGDACVMQQKPTHYEYHPWPPTTRDAEVVQQKKKLKPLCV